MKSKCMRPHFWVGKLIRKCVLSKDGASTPRLNAGVVGAVAACRMPVAATAAIMPGTSPTVVTPAPVPSIAFVSAFTVEQKAKRLRIRLIARRFAAPLNRESSERSANQCCEASSK